MTLLGRLTRMRKLVHKQARSSDDISDEFGLCSSLRVTMKRHVGRGYDSGRAVLRIVCAGGLLVSALAILSCSPDGIIGQPAGTFGSRLYRGTFAALNYAPTTLDVSLTTRSGTTVVTGAYSTGNGITGEVQGTLTGTLDSGTFSGNLTYNTSPLGGTNCAGTGAFSGSVDTTKGLEWTSPGGFRSNCQGDPTGITVQAPPGGSGPLPAPSPSLPAIGMFTASPTTTTAGQSVTLAWSGIVNAANCSINNGVGAVSCVDGSTKVTPSASTTYILTASGAGGSVTATAAVTLSTPVPQAPIVSFFAANPSTIAQGQSSTLTWNGIFNATSCSINNGVGAISCANGSTNVTPGSTTTYTLTASGAGGNATATDTVTVGPPAPPPPPPPPTFSRCDFNHDGVVDGADVNTVVQAALSGSNDSTYDLNRDGVVNVQDVQIESNVATGVSACPP